MEVGVLEKRGAVQACSAKKRGRLSKTKPKEIK
jgi:hypothetical protein